MTKEVEELKKQISYLESELAASMKREETKAMIDSGGGSLKQKIKNKMKNTRLWRAADDPNDKLGKIIRSPRTIARIVTNPSVAREVREKNRHVRGGGEEIFRPIKFFFGEGKQKRVNVVMEEIDLGMVEMGIWLAEKEKMELRVVTTKEKVDAAWYRRMVKEKKLPKFDEIDFYSTAEQNVKAKIFELEVSGNDVFLTKAWNNGNEK